VVVHGPDTQVVYANLRAAELLGLSEAQMLSKTVIDPGWHFVDEFGRRLAPPHYPVSRVLTSRQPLK
jgi:PAS domain-containing protein